MMFKTVLVPIDLADEHSWRQALPMAVAQADKTGAQMYVMTVAELNLEITAVLMPEDFNEQYKKKTEQRLAALVKRHVPDNISAQCLVRDGRVYREVLSVADDIKADLIVMASHTPSLQDYLLGTNAARVVRHAQCSVLVVREQS